MGFNAERPGVKISFDRIMARVAKTDGHSIMKQPDFLDHYLQEKEKNEHVDLSQVLGWLILNVRVRILDATYWSFTPSSTLLITRGRCLPGRTRLGLPFAPSFITFSRTRKSTESFGLL
jgi:hypothetical protein